MFHYGIPHDDRIETDCKISPRVDVDAEGRQERRAAARKADRRGEEEILNLVLLHVGDTLVRAQQHIMTKNYKTHPPAQEG